MGLLVNRGESQPLALTSAFRLPFIGAVSDDPKIRRRDDKTRERQQLDSSTHSLGRLLRGQGPTWAKADLRSDASGGNGDSCLDASQCVLPRGHELNGLRVVLECFREERGHPFGPPRFESLDLDGREVMSGFHGLDLSRIGPIENSRQASHRFPGSALGCDQGAQTLTVMKRREQSGGGHAQILRRRRLP